MTSLCHCTHGFQAYPFRAGSHVKSSPSGWGRTAVLWYTLIRSNKNFTIFGFVLERSFCSQGSFLILNNQTFLDSDVPFWDICRLEFVGNSNRCSPVQERLWCVTFYNVARDNWIKIQYTSIIRSMHRLLYIYWINSSYDHESMRINANHEQSYVQRVWL